jgi:hypothetical protein
MGHSCTNIGLVKIKHFHSTTSIGTVLELHPDPADSH